MSAFLFNLQAFAGRVGGMDRVFAVLKANGYGHGAVPCAQAALQAGVQRLMVGTCAEAEELRRAGIEATIHILGTLDPQEHDDALALRLIPSIQSIEQAQLLSNACRQRDCSITVHVKVDTGMGRLGMPAESLLTDMEKILALPGLEVEGIFSHLGDAADREVSLAQIESFQNVCDLLDQASYSIPVRHICNTTGATLYPQAHASGVRVGLGLYGVHDPRALHEDLPLRPVLRWTTTLHLIKDYPEGAALGYGGTFVTSRPSRIGVLPVGYADGYPRACSNRASVLIQGTKVPVVGTVSMDYTMVDLSHLPTAAIGDTVTLLGKDGANSVCAEDLAEWAQTIPYCITTGITTRFGFRVIPVAGRSAESQ